MIQKEDAKARRQIRHRRARKRIHGTVQRPRLSVFRSSRHIYAQVILDNEGRTLVAASTMEPALQEALAGKPKTEAARVVGRSIAERALQKGISQVVFDRGGVLYHGRVQALADAAREAGLEF